MLEFLTYTRRDADRTGRTSVKEASPLFTASPGSFPSLYCAAFAKREIVPSPGNTRWGRSFRL